MSTKNIIEKSYQSEFLSKKLCHFISTKVQMTCLSNMKTHFAFVTVLKNQTLVLQLDWGTFFNLYFSKSSMIIKAFNVHNKIHLFWDEQQLKFCLVPQGSISFIGSCSTPILQTNAKLLLYKSFSKVGRKCSQSLDSLN